MNKKPIVIKPIVDKKDVDKLFTKIERSKISDKAIKKAESIIKKYGGYKIAK